jgi:hypothetical protein
MYSHIPVIGVGIGVGTAVGMSVGVGVRVGVGPSVGVGVRVGVIPGGVVGTGVGGGGGGDVGWGQPGRSWPGTVAHCSEVSVPPGITSGEQFVTAVLKHQLIPYSERGPHV